MNAESPETVLRRTVKNNMSGTWEMTWHEDRLVSPGTPDISFVMLADDCETGWLELKAIAATDKKWQFKLEPSQPTWIDRHFERIPVYLLVAVGRYCWLLEARKYRLLQRHVTEDILTKACLAHFDFSDMRRVLSYNLVEQTIRTRAR